MADSKKVLLIGWDAADWKVIHELMDAGKMPTLNQMVENGVSGNMRTLTPALSPMLWTSIATGKRPWKHGIYGFTEPAPGGKGVQPMTNTSRKCKAVWNILNQQGLNSIVVGWWPSHPAEPIHGAMVSDFFHKAPKKPGDSWMLNKNSVHPRELLEELSSLRVHPLEMTAEEILPFVPDGAEIDQKVDGRVSQIMKVTAECSTIQAAATHLLETIPWDFAAIYFDAIDHYCHGFMKYRAPKQDHVSEEDFRFFKDVVSMGYIYHDMMLRKLLEFAGPETTVILMSDHGFHPDHLRPESVPSEPAGPAVEHRDFGIFVAMGPGIKKDAIIHGAGLLDVTPTILSIFGLPAGDDMDGRVLEDIFESPRETPSIPGWDDVPGDSGRHPKGMKMEAADAEAAMEQLVALGYIDRPDANQDKAIANCVRELDYNLARSYMDGGMYGEALPLLLGLYQKYPLEFRFGIQLANCFRVLSRNSDLKRLVEDLNLRWRTASLAARKKMREIARISRERRAHWKKLQELDAQNDDPSMPALARIHANGKPILFDQREALAIRRISAIARGNPKTVDFLAANVATSESNFEEALELLRQAGIAESKDPGFQYQTGNVYLELGRVEEAERAFLAGLEHDDSHPNCLMGLCRVYGEQGRAKKAVEYGMRAVGFQYFFPLAHFFVGKARFSAGDDEGAIRHLKIALDQNPNFAEAHEQLAGIYQKSDLDRELAIQHRGAARLLRDANRESVEEAPPIDWEPYTSDQLAEQVGEIFAPENSAEFLPCLSQARREPGVFDPTDGPDRPDAQERTEVIVVSGLPRTGTSLIMQMLKAGGVELWSDGARKPDQNNPKGYYEADAVKRLHTSNVWVSDCAGKALKVVAPLVPWLPQNCRYKVIFMRRAMEEVIGSQTDMLAEMGQDAANAPEEGQLARVFSQQAWLAVNLLTLYENPVLRLAYDDVVSDPMGTASRIAEFLEISMDLEAMAAAVDPSLSRQKSKIASL